MWPKLTNIDGTIYTRLLAKSDPQVATTLNAWIRVFSGAVVGGSQGLIISSANTFDLFRAAGEAKPTVYGTDSANGAIGVSWDGKLVGGGADRGFRPNPIITGFDSTEGTDQISREANLQIKCFSLYQLEYLQKYFMEPGYSLCIEWGWNTVGAAKNLIDTSKGVSGILSAATSTNLDYKTLHQKRVSSQGDYDSYLGFIVGCSIKGDGETYELSVKMKGSPSLPTFMQSQAAILKTDESGKVIEPESVKPFGPSQLKEGGADVANSGPRKFKKMFNNLPAHRQLQAVKDLVDSAHYSQFVNFDEYVLDQITDFNDGSFWTGDNIDVEGVDIKKDGFISDKKFIKMELLVKILNTNGALQSLKMGSKEVTLQIDISNTVIGAFPNMYSTNANKLIIPGNIPDFSVYYLSSAEVTQGDNGILTVDGSAKNPVDTSTDFGGVRFVQNTALDSNGLKEKANYWGYLKNLYVNFDVFKSALESKNKTIREVLTDILNDCSSAVNSFWNFQIVEDNVDDKVILTVIDENWIGSKPVEEAPRDFYNSGFRSPFLDGSLDMNLPGSLASQIVARRLSFATNPDEQKIEMGNFFSSAKDLFLQSAIQQNGSNSEETGTDGQPPEPQPTESEKLAEQEAAAQAEMDRLQKENEQISTQIREYNTKFRETHDYGQVQADYRKQSDPSHPVAKLNAKLRENRAAIDAKRNERNNARINKGKAAQKEKEDAEAAKKANLTANLNKLCILPKPSYKSLGTLSESLIENREQAIKLFGFYTFEDEKYFDRLRENAFADDSGSGKLSHPLPIKYSFTILGTSGLRRGDTFNIIGIPTIYRNQGLFQIVNVSHQVDGMSWKTTVEGQYRQKQ